MTYVIHEDADVRPLYRGAQFIWYILGIIETLLALRLLMKLLGANAGATFTSLLYGITEPLTRPFAAVFGVTYVEGSIFEWTTLLAMFVYYLIGWGIIQLFAMGRPVSNTEAAATLHEIEHHDEL